MFTRTILMALACAALAAGAAPAGAQGRGKVRFPGMDSNGDGVITRDEWRGSLASFRVHDWNGDGVLSGDELKPAVRPPVRRADRDDYERERDNVFTEWTEARFYELDHNRDGRLTRAEWHFDAESFRRADHNGDGRLTLNEFLGRHDDDDRADVFVNLDYNRDNVISRSEWHGSAAAFDRLDRNRDGVISRTEMTEPGDEPPDPFISLDINRDQRISLNEWHWSRFSFDSRDLDHDGVLSRQEFAAAVGTSGRIETRTYRLGHDRGLADGKAAGREDRVNGHGWDLEGQTELERADAGYSAGLGPIAEYQAGYRAGFRAGYREGFGPRQ